MIETAETSLGELRAMVDLDPGEDLKMTEFVNQAVGYKDSARVFITVSGRFVTYSIGDRKDA